MAKRNFSNITKNFQKVQQDLISQMQNDFQNVEIEGVAAGDMVKVILDGSYNMKSLKISPDLVDPSDIEFLEDSIIAAFNDAHKKMNLKLDEKLGVMEHNLLSKLKV